MRVRIVMPEGVHELETEGGWGVNDTARPPSAREIPCHRCGVCCERWQPLLTPADAARLATHLGLSLDAFHIAYTSPYPFNDEQRLLRQEESHCVFLRYEADGRSACAVHAARPQVCREWSAGLDKKECVQGLKRFTDPAGLIQLQDLYPGPADRAAFVRAARSSHATASIPAPRQEDNRAGA